MVVNAASLPPAVAKDEIRQGKLYPVYLLIGPSDHLAGEVERSIRQACFPLRDEEQVGYARWEDGDLESALSFLATVPFLGGRRLARVAGISDTGAALQGLEAYLENPPPWAVLILRVAPGSGGRLATLCQRKGTVVDCQVARGQMPQWVQERARDKGLRMGPATAWLLAQLCNEDADLVQTELDKLSLAVDTGRPVTEEVLRQHVFPGQEPPFALADHWAQRHLTEALASLARLLGQGTDASRLVGTLAWQVRSMLACHYLQGQGIKALAELAKGMEISPAAAKVVVSRARGFSTEELEKALILLAGIDWEIKTGRTRPEQALERFLVVTLGARR